MRKIKLLVFSVLLSLVFNNLYLPANAQTGSVSGTIRDKKTKETIVGANILIKGTTIGSISDLDGRFLIQGIKKGAYTIVISFISYKTITLDDIKVSETVNPDLEIELEESIASLEGVTVTANRKTNTDLSIINSIKKAEVVVSGISAQQIKRSQDKDASEVVKRIPGVTVVGNKYIRIRGLSERYNQVLLNELPAPSMETDVRSFSFDIVPSSLIERILIFKSASPELPGDFTGGLVKIFTRSIPESNFLEISYGAGYRKGSSLEEFKRQENNSFYWTGFNDGKHDLPDGFPEDLRKANPAQLISAGRSLPNSWVPVTSNSGLNHSVNVTGGLKFKAGKAEIGNITSILYNNAKAIRDVHRYDYMEYDTQNDRSSVLYSFIDKEDQYNIRTGFLHNWALKYKDHIIEFKNFFNQLSQQQYVLRTGIHYDFNYVPENHSFDQEYRGIYTTQLNGSHTFAGQKLVVDWVAGYNMAYRDQPDYRRYRSDVDTIEESKTLYIPLGSASAYFLGRFFSKMNEQTMNGNVALTYYLKGKSENSPFIKVGVTMEDKLRDFKARNIGYVRTTMSDPYLQYLTIDQLFKIENINGTTGIRIDEQSNAADSYEAGNELLAGFINLYIPAGRKFNISGGIRYENNRQNLESKALSEEVINETTNVLPSINFTYNLNQKMLLRSAYGFTINRPEFRELAPFGFYDFSFNLVKKGNPELKDAKIHNLDIRWEFYPSQPEMISLGLFYKNFIDPIETQFVPGGGSGGIKDFSYGNAESAKNMGLEIEIRKSLAGMTNSSFINDLTIIFNSAIISSKVELGDSLVRQSNHRPMQGQAPYIVNFGIFYRNMKNDLQLNAQWNVTGKYIYSIGFDVYPDVYQMPRHVIDISLIKGLGKHFEIKAGISDLLNTENILLQDANQDGVFDSQKDQVIQRYAPGTSFSAGINYKF